MGGSSSRSSQGQGPPLSALPQAPPEPPYYGPPAEYRFVDTDVVIGCKMSILTSPMVTSNIDSYYSMLNEHYAHGYRLLSFYRIPGRQNHTMFSFKATLGYQGIFCRYPSAPRREGWQLRVEKSAIQLSNEFRSGIILGGVSVVSDTTHLFDAIARNTQGGGRLICVEMTGEQQAGSMRQAMRGLSPLLGVDLFFEVPTHPGPHTPQYVYTCVSVPIQLKVGGNFMRPTPTSHCNWEGVLGSHLNQGWRLVEIFIDKGMQSRAGFRSQASMNSVWFFEKAASRMNDPRPVYQGTVVDHEIKLQTKSLNRVVTTTNWESVIQDMGSRGWELACILELFQWRMSGWTTGYMACKMFFQRPILHLQAGGGSSADGLTTPSDLPPPPYDIAVGWGGGGGWGQAAGSTAFAPPPPPHLPPPPPQAESQLPPLSEKTY